MSTMPTEMPREAPRSGPARGPEAPPASLAPYVAARVVAAEDVAATAVLVGIARREVPAIEPDLLAWLAMALALRAPRDGHTCVDLASIADWRGAIDPATAGHPNWPLDPAVWKTSITTAGPLVGTPGARSPFILDGERIYLARSLDEEEQIAARIGREGEGAVHVLLGGPGTGKTTLVSKLLVDELRDRPEARIALAASTGKAAARMGEALRSRLQDVHAPEEVRFAAPDTRAKIGAITPVTVHRLLGVRPSGSRRYKHGPDNRLALDLVVVDEASMLSSTLMHRLLEALGDTTRLVLVGDPFQLASVEAGSVLGDIARAAALPGSALAKRTTTLAVRHRFGKQIGELADAVLAGGDFGVARAFEILRGAGEGSPDTPPPAADTGDYSDTSSAVIRWVEPGSVAYREILAEARAHADRLRGLAEAGQVAEALAAHREMQVLCAHRAGSSGVSGWNSRLSGRKGGGQVTSAPIEWHAGLPVMVTQNNAALDLFNGDVGLVVPGAVAGQFDVAFPVVGAESVRRVPASRLEEMAVVHALTIHKSQGSEYGHAVVVLPDRPSRILTRELLYTGITRAVTRVTLVGSGDVIEAAIRTPIRRATGLAERLTPHR